MPISRPNWVSESPSSALILTPMMEKIVQTAKQTVKASVDMDNARVAARSWLDGSWAGSVISCSIDGVGGAALWLKTKKPPARSVASGYPGCEGT